MWWIRHILTVCPVYSHTQTVLSEISLLIFLFLSSNNPRFIWLRNKCVLLTNRDKLCCYQLPQIWELKCNYCMIYLHLFIFRKSWSVFRQVVSDVIRQVHNDKKHKRTDGTWQSDNIYIKVHHTGSIKSFLLNDTSTSPAINWHFVTDDLAHLY